MPNLLFYKRELWLCIGLLFLAFRADAQRTDSLLYRELPDVEVVEKARPSVIREGAPLQWLDRSEMERLGIRDLPEAVRRFSGVTIRDYGGIGGLKTVSVRSLGSQHTAVSYDGVTITDAQSGQVDISRFTLDHVESVSLSIGQTDDIFQTARMYASAGALRIWTQAPRFDDRPFRLEGQVKGGSYGLLSPSLRYERRLGSAFAASIHAGWLSADGAYPYTFTNGSVVTREERKNSDIRSLNAELNLFAGWENGGTLRFKVYGFDSHRGLPGSVVLYNDYHTERLRNRNVFVQSLYENSLNSRLTLRVQGKVDYSQTRYSDFHSKYVGGQQTDAYIQREYYASGALRYAPSGELSFSVAEDAFINTLDATTPLCAFPERFTSLTALAAQYKDSRLTATASLLGTYITEEVKRGRPAANRRRLSPAVSLSYRLFSEQNLRIRLSFKDIFRVPTFNDLYYDRVGSKDLEPEMAVQYNAGLTWSAACGRSGYISLTADTYYNKVTNKIVAMPTMFIWSMMNLGEVAIRGLDVNLSARLAVSPALGLQAGASYTLQKAVDVTRKDAKTYGHQLPYTPQHAGTLALAMEHPWINAGWTTTLVGPRYALPQNIAANRMEGYVEHQLSLHRSFRLGQGAALRLQAEIVNLGDASYDVIRYYPMPGRSFRASIRYSY
ncbi:MAG: TonB-dependent receptor [Tannerellaceae bacterium]|jgi:outer membrane cobalamin receptor|nr:TonB-dependent receptor [Tannerellaceae bacterium]